MARRLRTALMSPDMTPTERRPPRWLRYANRVNAPLLRRGIGPATQRVLAIPGRKTGLMRATPVAVVTVATRRYVVAGYAASDWVRNARVARRGVLQRGRASERVTLTEISSEESPEILREFARSVRGGRAFLTVNLGASDAEFAAASHRHPVFRIDPDATAQSGP